MLLFFDIFRCHKGDLKLVPELIRIINFHGELRRVGFCFEQFGKIVSINEVILGKQIVVYFELGVIPLERL